MSHIITIGNDLRALQHAYENNTKLIINRPNFPLPYMPSWHIEAWALLYTKLMLDGKVVGGDRVEKIKIQDKILYIVGEMNSVIEQEYQCLHIFCDENLIGLPVRRNESDFYRVVDVLKPLSCVVPCGKIELTTEDTLVYKLYTIKDYSSAPIKIYSLSTLVDHQLSEFDYSDTMVKFKSEELLSHNGFVGNITPHGRSSVVLEVVERLLYKSMSQYSNTDEIKFFYGSDKFQCAKSR